VKRQIKPSKEKSMKKPTSSLMTNILAALTNHIFFDSTHSISLIFEAKCKKPTKLKLKGHSKCKRWSWESWDNLPTPYISSIQLLVDSGYHPFFENKTLTKENKQNNCFIF
jgi:hypothetical protein